LHRHYGITIHSNDFHVDFTGCTAICPLIPDHGAPFFLTPRLQDSCTCRAAILQMARARCVPTCLRSSPRCACVFVSRGKNDDCYVSGIDAAP
jgi:hypothetical protein